MPVHFEDPETDQPRARKSKRFVRMHKNVIGGTTVYAAETDFGTLAMTKDGLGLDVNFKDAARVLGESAIAIAWKKFRK